MAGVPAAVGAIASTAVLTVALAAVGSAAVSGQRAAGAADAAALAAADAASGAVPGVPCERAAQIGAAWDVEIATCEVDGLVATVSVAGRFGVLPVTAWARAGPPSSEP
jgi:secretion/DNA translocation related TadE-like protein